MSSGIARKASELIRHASEPPSLPPSPPLSPDTFSPEPSTPSFLRARCPPHRLRQHAHTFRHRGSRFIPRGGGETHWIIERKWSIQKQPHPSTFKLKQRALYYSADIPIVAKCSIIHPPSNALSCLICILLENICWNPPFHRPVPNFLSFLLWNDDTVFHIWGNSKSRVLHVLFFY